jgi:hypothetical protein
METGTYHIGGDQPAVHGMLMVGNSNVYLSHLPMFHLPHDYQVLLEVTLREERGGLDPAARYRKDRETTGEAIYTWMPKPFILSTLLLPGSSSSMVGAVFRGHFERGGVPITSNQVQADISRVLYYHQFAAADEAPRHLRYLLFGTAAEPFVAHVITRAPDYDHVLAVDLGEAPAGWNGTAMPLEFQGRQNVQTQRLKPQEELDAVAAELKGASVHLTVRQELYFETGDLSS